MNPFSSDNRRWHIIAMLLVLGATVAVRQLHAQDAASDPPPTETAAEPAAAEEPAAPMTADAVAETARLSLDTLWVLVAGFLVFFMQAGFALVKAGLTRAKNAVHICMKNMLDFCFATLLFWICGFGIMFGAGTEYFGISGFFLNEVAGADPPTFDSLSWNVVSVEARFFFQLVFAGVGAVAAWCLVTGFMLFFILKATVGLRASAAEEQKGLDICDHGMEAYPNLQLL